MAHLRYILRAALTLAWEVWQRGRGAAWGAISITLGCWCFNFFAPPAAPGFGARASVFTFLMVLAFALAFVVFHCTEFQPGKDWHGFPYRWFVLPVPTLLLVACPMALGLLTIELLELVWSRLIFAPIGVRVPDWLGLILGSGLLSLQTVLWSLAGFRVTRIVLLSIVALLFVNLSFALMSPDLAPSIPSRVIERATFGLGWLAVLSAWFAINRQRRGGGRGRGWLKHLLGRAFDQLPRRHRPFASAAGAQFWYEWRRAGWLLPASTAAALLFVFVPVVYLCRRDPDLAWWIIGWIVALPIVLAAVIGKGFAKPDIWSANLAFPGFLAVRPLTNGDLVISKMRVAVLSTIASWLLVAGFLAVWLPSANTVALRQDFSSWTVALGRGRVAAAVVLLPAISMLLTWRLLVNGLWTGLAGDRKLYLGALGANLAAVALGIWAMVTFVNQYQPTQLAAWVTWLSWGMILAALTRLWGAVFSWKNISRLRVMCYALLWLGGTVLLIVLAWAACPPIFWLQHLVVLAALLPFPLARLGLAARSLASNRHHH